MLEDVKELTRNAVPLHVSDADKETYPAYPSLYWYKSCMYILCIVYARPEVPSHCKL